mgnify:CR=1 FL=1
MITFPSDDNGEPFELKLLVPTEADEPQPRKTDAQTNAAKYKRKSRIPKILNPFPKVRHLYRKRA